MTMIPHMEEDTLVSLFEIEVKNRSAFLYPTYEGNDDFYLQARQQIRDKIKNSIGIGRMKMNHDQGRKNN
jgi:hypothetical protein